MAHSYPCPPETMQNILSCIPHLYTWTYDPDGTLIATTCPNRAIFHELFFQCDYMQQILDYAKNASSPYALSIYMGLVWYAVLEKEENILKRFTFSVRFFQYPGFPQTSGQRPPGIRRPGNEFPVPPSAPAGYEGSSGHPPHPAGLLRHHAPLLRPTASG